MKSVKLACAIATLTAGMTMAASAQQTGMTDRTTPKTDGEEVTLTGCVVKGTGGYVLSNAIRGLRLESSVTTKGTSGKMEVPTAAEAKVPEERLIYWLSDKSEQLDPHAGHRVEVVGRVDGDIGAGAMEIERENGMIEIELSAKGEKVTVKLPDTAAGNATAVNTSGTVAVDKPKDLPFKVQRVDVKTVKMLGANCV